MGEELETAVATQVVLHTAVDATALACGEILEAQGEGLLILLEALPTLGIERARDARGECIADGCAVGVLLDVDRRDGEAGGGTGCGLSLIKAPLIGAPVTSHQA